MEKRSIAQYVWLGTSVRYLVDASPGYVIYGDGALAGNIEDLLDTLETAEFFVSMRLAAGLGELRNGWMAEADQDERTAAWRDERRLSPEEHVRLHRIASTLRDAVVAEAQGKVAFIASDGRYAVGKLLGEVGSLLGKGVFDSLPLIAQKDLAEAGRAIAFDLPTAAAFHTLRATEAALRSFYLRTVKRGRIREPRMWAGMTNALRARNNPPPAVLLNNLDSLRINFRNPTQHPEMTYEMDEVQDLFALAVDAINRMAKS